MKKVLGIALMGILATACSKKEADSTQESNIMLQEPKVEMTATETKEAVTETADVVIEEAKEEVKETQTAEAPAEEAK